MWAQPMMHPEPVQSDPVFRVPRMTSKLALRMTVQDYRLKRVAQHRWVRHLTFHLQHRSSEVRSCFRDPARS